LVDKRTESEYSDHRLRERNQPMITIYQIRLTNEQIDAVNVNGFHAVPAALAKTRMGISAEKWNEDYVKFYSPVYKVATDDLDEAFELTNLWEDESRITRLQRGSSASVGDVFVKDGNCYIVDDFGFVNVGKYDLV